MPQTLLLADDSATIQRVIELTFAGEDIKVIAVSDGDQAIARIQSAPPDIVLADIGMPGKTGYEVAEFVKHTPRLAHIPVVLLTGAFEPVDQAKAAAAGCDGVLAKPFEPQIVIGRVRELLGKGSAPATASNVVEFAPAPPEPPPASAEPPAASPEPKVEDYFDRLDAAFASFSNAPAAAAAAPAPAPVPEELDWLRPTTAEAAPAPPDFAIADELAAEPPEPAAVPEPEPDPAPSIVSIAREEVSRQVSEPAAAEPEPQPAAPPAPLERLEPLEPRGPRALPGIADAFAAILAAEQNALGVRPEWPTPAPSGQPEIAVPQAPAEIVITDELVDRVARRVLEQMSDRVVRETVAQLTSDVAERLVRDEIERIKAATK